MDRRQLVRPSKLRTQTPARSTSHRFDVKKLVCVALCTYFGAACGARSELWIGESQQGGSGGSGGTGGTGAAIPGTTSSGDGGTTTTVLPPSCGLLCPNGPCNVEVLAEAGSIVFSVTTDSTYVYWVEGFLSDPNSVRRAPKNGGPVEIIKSNAVGASSVRTAGPLIYWTELGTPNIDPPNGAVYRRASSGGPIEIVLSGQAAPDSLTTFGQDAYWANISDGLLYTAKPGGPATLVQALPSDIRDIATNGSNLYYVWGTPAGTTLEFIPIQGGAPTPLIDDLVDPRRLAVVGSDVYMTEINVGVWHTSGPNTQSLLVEGNVSVGLAADSEAVYYFEGGALRRLCRDGSGPPEYLVETNSAYAVTVDESGVYFDYNEKVGKIAK